MSNFSHEEKQFPPNGTRTKASSGSLNVTGVRLIAISIQARTSFSKFVVRFEDGTTSDVVSSWGLDNPQKEKDFIYPGDGREIVEYTIDGNGGQVQELHG